MGYSIWGYKESDTIEQLTDTDTETHTHTPRVHSSAHHTKKHYVYFQGTTTKIVKSNELRHASVSFYGTSEMS